ncbi:unnamed protein product [Alternaria alternata]
MDTATDGRLPPPPAANPEAENAALTPHVLETGAREKDGIVEAVEHGGNVSTKQNKVPKAGLKNYFVN